MPITPKFTVKDSHWLSGFHIALDDNNVAAEHDESGTSLEVIRLQQLLRDQRDANSDLKLMIVGLSISILLLFAWVIVLGWKLWGK